MTSHPVEAELVAAPSQTGKRLRAAHAIASPTHHARPAGSGETPVALAQGWSSGEDPAMVSPVMRAVYYQASFLAASIAVLGIALLLKVQSGGITLTDGTGYFPVLCFWRQLTGIDCPGCGLTRCFVSMAHGQFDAAWHYNPLGTVLFVLVVIQIPFRLWQLYRLRRGIHESDPVSATALFCAVVAALVVQWAIRIVV